MFHYKNPDEIREEAKKYDIALPFSKDAAALGEPLRADGWEIRNRIAIQPMEGCDGNIYKEHGIEVISLGMGNDAAHALNESVSVSDLERSGELVEGLVLAYSAHRQKNQ